MFLPLCLIAAVAIPLTSTNEVSPLSKLLYKKPVSALNLETEIETGDLSQYTLPQNVFPETSRTVKVCHGSVKTILEQSPYEISSSSIPVSRLNPKQLTLASTNSEVDDVVTEAEEAMESTFYDPKLPQYWYWSPYDAQAEMPHTIQEFKHASGNWLGVRDTLDKRGIEFSTTYTCDIAGNPVGGKIPGGFTYMDNLALGCLVETEKLLGWHGGYFMVSGAQRDGISLSQKNIKNQFIVQQVSGIGAGAETFHFYELSYQQYFLKDCLGKDRVGLKFGRVSAGDEFAISPLYFLYMNKGIDAHPSALATNGRFSTYPNAVWGGRLKVNTTSTTVARLGVYQVTNPSVNGLNWNIYPSNGAMVVGQLNWNPEFFKRSSSSSTTNSPQETSNKEKSTQLATTSSIKKEPSSDDHCKAATEVKNGKGLIGHYWMGGYYSSWEYPQFNSKLKAPNAYGLYWHADQMVYRPNSKEDTGLVLWSAYTLCPQENISLLPFQVTGGSIYTGLIPGRKEDFTIAGFTYGNFSTNYAGVQRKLLKPNPTYELVYEFGYRVNMTKFFYVQPDLQWVINPAGTGTIPNAVVLGAQMGVIF